MSEPPRPRLAPGIAAGLALCVPVALRAGLSTDQKGPATVLALAAASLVVVPLGLWIRGAGLKERLKDPASLDRALLYGAALSSLPLALFGGVLKSGTHHRPLGGATFAVGACAVVACCIALTHRVGSGAKAHWLRYFFDVCCWLSLAVTVAFAASAAHILLDFLTLAAACIGAGSLKIPLGLSRLPALAVLLIWAVLLAGGLALTQKGAVVRALQDRAPISFASLSWLGDGS